MDEGGPESLHPAKGRASGQSPRPVPAQRRRAGHCVCSQTKDVYELHALISGVQVSEQNNPGYMALSCTRS